MQAWRFSFVVAGTLLFAASGVASRPINPGIRRPRRFAASGEVIRVENVSQLFAAAEQVRPGGTILLADGVYAMPRYFELHTNNVTLRSERGQRDRVILDGTDSQDGELVGVSHCSGVTIADLTIQNIKWNGFKINSDKRATHVTIRNCVIHNIWQRGVKGPAMGSAGPRQSLADGLSYRILLVLQRSPQAIRRRSGRHAGHVSRQLHWRHRRHARQRVDHS